jgi:type VI secretion system protein ImpG
LTLVDLQDRPAPLGEQVLAVEVTCCNRDLPARLPYGGGHPRLTLIEGGAGLAGVTCLTPPTRTRRRPVRPGLLWRLVSQLTLNHLSLGEEEDDGADALREILSLYDIAETPESRAWINAVASVRSHRVLGWLSSPLGGSAVGPGVEVAIRFDEARCAGGLFLYASVLERFLALYCSINTFSRLVALTTASEKEYFRWAARAGERTLR